MSPQIMKDFRGWIRTALRCGALVVLGFVFLALATPPVVAGQPCCGITAIDLKTGIVTAKVNATGQTFEFKVTNQALLKSLKLGQGIYANFQTHQVSVDGIQPCCDIVSLSKAAGVGNTAAGRTLGNTANPGDVCCPITSIDEAAGVVTAKVNSTGQTFQFKVADVALLHSLKVGQGVFANFKTQKVSVDGVQPCCDVISAGAGKPIGQVGKPSGPVALQPAAGQPCCNVTSINAATGVVTAKVNSTGQVFAFKVGSELLLQSLKVGQGVYANLKMHQVSIDNMKSCCQIISAGTVPLAQARGGPDVSNAGVNAAAPASSTPMPGSSVAEGAKPTAPGSSQGRGIQVLFTRTIDPCSVATATQLQTYAAGGLSKAFPITDRKEGDALTLYDPVVNNATCVPPPFHIWIQAKAHFKKTRGFPQFESTGHILFDSLVVGQIVSTAPANDQVTAANFQSAALCFTDVHVDDFNLKNIPNWYDDVYMRRVLNDDLAGKEKCADVSALVSLYLQSGHSIPAAAQANSPGKASVVGPALQRTVAKSPQAPLITPPVFAREPVQLRILSQGKKWRLHSFTGTINARPVQNEMIYQVVEREGILESPLPQPIKDELLKDSDRSGPNDRMYFVHKTSAEMIAERIQILKLNSGPSNAVQQTGSSDNGCKDAFGWGNHLTQTATISYSTPGDLLMLTLSDTDLGQPSNKIPLDVNVSGTLNLRAPMSGSLSGAIELSILDFACQPIAFKLKEVGIDGSADIGASVDLDAKLGVTHEFKKRLSHPLGGFGFFIGPIPVYIGYEAFVEGRLKVTAPNLVEVKYSAHGNGHGGLTVKCTMHRCQYTPGFSFTWSDTGAVNFLGQGVRAIVKPGVLGGLEAFLYSEEILNVHAGVEPYVKGDFWAYTGTDCEVRMRGSVTGQGGYTKALTADVDGGFDILAGIDASGLAPNGFFSGLLDQEFTLYNWEKHLLFRDFIGSSALKPELLANTLGYAAHPQNVTLWMRSCYPYKTDKDGNPVKMTYQVAWGDGTPDSIPQGAAPSATAASHTWQSAGTFLVQVWALKDSHGREFLPPEITEVSFEVGKSGTTVPTAAVHSKKPQ